MISIIVPTFNRFEIVRETILKTIGIESDIEFEVIVVNDGEALPFTISHPKLRMLKNPERGAASARNYGAAHAKYDLFFFIDDDMWITEESLNAIKELYDSSFLATNCAVLNWQFPDPLISEMKQDKIGRYLIKADFHTLEGRLKRKIDYTNKLFKVNSIGSGSFAISKKRFIEIGGYNEVFMFQGEDIDLSNRLNESGTGIFLYTGITCYHNQRDRLEIDLFLDREYRGFISQFNNNQSTIRSNPIKKIIFTVLMPFSNAFLLIFKLIPNKPCFDSITFRTIGILSSIMYFKAWYDVENKKSSND